MGLKKLIANLVLLLLPLSTLATNTTDSVRTTPLKGTVSLTFDDGPSPIYTPEILAILKKYDVKATFFMVGINAKKYPEIVKMVLAEGHAIDNHTLTHPMLTQLNDAELHKEIISPQIIIFNIIGKKPVCLRYPFGASNSHVREEIRAQGILPVPMGWNSFDYERPGVDKIVAQVVNFAHSGQVILLHDGYDKRDQTVAALPKIIEGIKKKGLGFSQICVN
jgi:peptidoglycan/xylan/chitin deacetylase (PgdA/CDA1 family)